MIKYDIMNNYGSVLQLISFIDRDIAKYVDNNSEVKTLYLKNKDILDEFYDMHKYKKY